MDDEYLDPEFPEMEIQPEEVIEHEENMGLLEENLETDEGENVSVSDEVREQVDLELIESSPDAQDYFTESEYLPEEDCGLISQDSEGVLFQPEDDPLSQPMVSEFLNTVMVYNRPVSKRLRHLVCERQQQVYLKPRGLYRPGG